MQRREEGGCRGGRREGAEEGEGRGGCRGGRREGRVQRREKGGEGTEEGGCREEGTEERGCRGGRVQSGHVYRMSLLLATSAHTGIIMNGSGDPGTEEGILIMYMDAMVVFNSGKRLSVEFHCWNFNCCNNLLCQRNTPTSAGPNSFYKTARGFTDPRSSWRGELEKD